MLNSGKIYYINKLQTGRRKNTSNRFQSVVDKNRTKEPIGQFFLNRRNASRFKKLGKNHRSWSGKRKFLRKTPRSSNPREIKVKRTTLIRKIQWLNYFTNTTYRDSKAGPNIILYFADVPWGTGSNTWNFFPRQPALSRAKRRLLIKKERILPIEFFPSWYFLLKLRYKTYVPARYLYIINSLWTPYYVTNFYLAKLYKKNWAKYFYKQSKVQRPYLKKKNMNTKNRPTLLCTLYKTQ